MRGHERGVRTATRPQRQAKNNQADSFLFRFRLISSHLIVTDASDTPTPLWSLEAFGLWRGGQEHDQDQDELTNHDGFTMAGRV
jgi:hypothetical protein